MPGWKHLVKYTRLFLSAVLPPVTASVGEADLNSLIPPYLTEGVVNTAPTTGSLLWQFLQFVLLFGLIILLVVVVTRFFGRRLANLSSGKTVRVLDWTYLGQNRAVYAVAVGEQVLILGVTEHQINLLTEITDPQQCEEMRKPGTGSSYAPSGGWLSSISNLRKTNIASTDQDGGFPNYLESQLHRLRNLAGNGERTGQSLAQPTRRENESSHDHER